MSPQPAVGRISFLNDPSHPQREKTMRTTRLHHAGLALLAVLLLSIIETAPGLAQEGTDEEKLNQGAQLYSDNCAVCHGPEGDGRVGATLAKDWPSIRPDLQVQQTIENGIPGSVMPAWSQENGGPLGEAEIDALVYYILSWQTGGPPIIAPTPAAPEMAPLTPPPDVSGDPNNGAALYAGNCAVCHGPNGEGRVGATLAKDFPSIRPDLQIKETIANGVSGSVMPAWSQANGGPLTETEVDDLVAYILAWSSPAGAPVETAAPVSQPGQPGNRQFWLILAVIAIVVAAGAVFAARNLRR
jgi:mono/diheme cytochrome c family protein